MIFLIILIMSILAIGMIAHTRRYLGKSANYIVYFNLLWVVGAILTSLGLYNSFVPPIKIYIYIFIMLLAFNVTTFFLINKNLKLKKYSFNNEILFLSKDKRKSKVNLLILLTLIILIFPTFLESVSYILVHGYSELRTQVLTFTNLLQWFLYHYGHPIIMAIMIIATIDVVFYKRNFIVFLIGLICVIMYITIFASRWMLAESILILVLSLLQKYGNKIINMLKRNKKIVILLSSGVALLLFITSQRSLSDTSIMQNIYYYIFGSINLFGVFSNSLDNYVAANGFLLGQVFFSGIVGVFYDVLKLLFGVNINSGITYINEVVQNYEYVSPTIRMNNNVTMLYAFVSDFGWLGLIIFPSIIAVFCFRSYKKVLLKTTKLNLSIYIYTFSLLLFGIVEWFPARATVILTYVFIYLLEGKRVRLR